MVTIYCHGTIYFHGHYLLSWSLFIVMVTIYCHGHYLLSWSLFIVMVTIYCHGHKRRMMHVINSSSKLHTLHTEKTIQENVINCKRQEANDKILSKKGINVHSIQFQHEFS